MADIKYNIYYSKNLKGPWTLANSTPINHSDILNQYTITGLNNATTYFLQIIGGVIEDDEFLPLITQSLRSNGVGAAGIEVAEAAAIKIRTFTPKGINTGSLGINFEVTI